MIKKKFTFHCLNLFLIINKSYASFDYSIGYISFKNAYSITDLPPVYNEQISTFSLVDNLNLTKVKLEPNVQSQLFFEKFGGASNHSSVTPEPLFKLNELPNDPLFNNDYFQSLIDSEHPVLDAYSNSWAPFIYPDPDNAEIPSFNSEFGLEKPALYGLQMIGMDTVWDNGFNTSFRGNDIKVAVLDTGIDYFHLDLTENITVFNDSGLLSKQKDLICDGEPQDEVCRQIDSNT